MSCEEVAPEGVYPIAGSNAIFLEPCRIITSSYSHFSALPHRYYSRSFFLPRHQHAGNPQATPKQQKKRKRGKLAAYTPNPKELLAQQRHQEIRKFILDAHLTFMALPEIPSLLKSLEDLVNGSTESQQCQDIGHVPDISCEMIDFVELGSVWQAPLYHIVLSRVNESNAAFTGTMEESTETLRTPALFKHMIENSTDEEVLGACASTIAILPKKSRFLMASLEITRHSLLYDGGHTGDGYNLILIDPPWENRSVHRHAVYSTLPNKYLLSLPLKELAHLHGALIGLWVTNREKLRSFVEKELFPAWGAYIQATWFWLKIKSDGQMIGELDTPHHKPYECLILGYIPPQGVEVDLQISAPKIPPDKQVLISIPGDHSRKPPLTMLLSAYVPGEGSVQGLELFARDLNPGWTSWGNEPLRFQQIHYFRKK